MTLPRTSVVQATMRRHRTLAVQLPTHTPQVVVVVVTMHPPISGASHPVMATTPRRTWMNRSRTQAMQAQPGMVRTTTLDQVVVWAPKAVLAVVLALVSDQQPPRMVHLALCQRVARLVPPSLRPRVMVRWRVQLLSVVSVGSLCARWPAFQIRQLMLMVSTSCISVCLMRRAIPRCSSSK